MFRNQYWRTYRSVYYSKWHLDGFKDAIQRPGVVPYAAAVGNSFLLMQDNARPHIARTVEHFLEAELVKRMECTAYCPDLNPIEHICDTFG